MSKEQKDFPLSELNDTRISFGIKVSNTSATFIEDCCRTLGASITVAEEPKNLDAHLVSTFVISVAAKVAADFIKTLASRMATPTKKDREKAPLPDSDPKRSVGEVQDHSQPEDWRQSAIVEVVIFMDGDPYNLNLPHDRSLLERRIEESVAKKG